MTLHQLTFSAWPCWRCNRSLRKAPDALNEGVEEPAVPVYTTFKDTLHVQSNETPAEGCFTL